MIKPITPKIPAHGTVVTVLGLKGTVTDVFPANDWAWSVEISVPNGGGGLEFIRMTVPTDFRTTDGAPAYV